ncbi:MAG: right-handed parallel beta-helix repeat-containing protein [Planctomycetota bacterium]
MRNTKVFMAVMLLCVVLSNAASAATYYVAPGGSDANPGTLAQPFASITKAQDAASFGDMVYLRGGGPGPRRLRIRGNRERSA